MLEKIIVCSLFSYGIFTVQRPGFILTRLPNLWKRILPESLHEPFFACGVCVVSVWGTLCYYYMAYVQQYCTYESLRLFLFLPVILVCATGLNALLDRSVKSFEKNYGYKTPQAKLQGEARWNYLVPYAKLRTMLVDQFVSKMKMANWLIVEVGGKNEAYARYLNYMYFDHTSRLNRDAVAQIINMQQKGYSYAVVILGLYYEGDIRDLRELIKYSSQTLIEYSDDGHSRDQIAYLTEGISTKMLIPEYEIYSDEKPQGCGNITRRKILILEP
jgi:hypothetical protein